MSDINLQDLFDNGKPHRLPKGQVLQLSDDRMLLNSVKAGYIKRYCLTNDGSQSIQAIYGPGNVFPLTPLFRVLYNTEIYRGPEIYYYETMTPTSLHTLNKDALLSALADDPMLYSDLFQLAGRRLQSNIQRLENMSLKTANRRVAHQLVHYCRVFGEKAPGGATVIQLPLTHQTLADILNLARETVTHCLNQLEAKGLITTNKEITVPDVDKLQRAIR